MTALQQPGTWRLTLEWRRAAGCPEDGANLRPLLVLLPWLWAGPGVLDKYITLAHRQGCDVVVARWPWLAQWIGAWCDALAAELAAALVAELHSGGERPLIFWCFSGSAKVCMRGNRTGQDNAISFSSAALGMRSAFCCCLY